LTRAFLERSQAREKPSLHLAGEVGFGWKFRFDWSSYSGPLL
jgi:hypothetical protein